MLLMARIRERDKRCGAESALEANVHHLFLVRNMFFFWGTQIYPFTPSKGCVMSLASFRWVTRYSARGVPYQVGLPDMPWIDPQYLESVVYLYPSEAAAEDGDRIGGSGFLVSRQVIAKDRSMGDLLCVVTNKHVIDSGNMVVRINTIDGKKDIIPLDGAKWYGHPNGDDIVVCPIKLSTFHRFKHLPASIFLTKEWIEQFEIGPGDDVFFVGRFVNHEGRERNLPSVRFGNISQMPLEPIMIDGRSQESFLVEARSISGYSGSPVFVYLPQQGTHGLNPEVIKMVRDGKMKLPGVSSKRIGLPIQIGPWLLGIDFCHIRWDEPIWSKTTREPVGDDWFIKSNTGMMGVVPAWKLHEILEGPEMKPVLDHARKLAEEVAKKNSSVELDVSVPSKSSPPANGENPTHREDFTRLLGAAAKAHPTQKE